MIAKRLNETRIIFLLGALALLWLLSVGVALAADGFAIPWWTVDGGGGQSIGGSYTVTGTLGQPDTAISSAGPYGLSGGFWGAPGSDNQAQVGIYLPFITR